ncbi:MAG TPA: Ppx/GppA family phosphatase [Planctomycetota bacterium]|jgi:exopolyphosphatase/guanosine-5'-triphosphate,3'-diphosphate pyrophosphatase
MIIGAIDVGSNSVKLLVAEVKGRTTRLLAHRSAVTRLGGRMDRTRRLSPAAQDRTIGVLREFRRVCEELGADRVVAVGTEAVRTARNGRTFAARCRKEAGVALRIISGREEARLAFLGATFGRRERRLAAIDIGGGSTEFMLGSPGRLETSASIPLGAVRLTEIHLKGDPPTLGDRLGLLMHVHDGLGRLPDLLRCASGPGTTLLGIGGTCVNVARMLSPDEIPEGRKVPLDALEDLLNRLAGTPLAQRKQIPGIDPDRADIIVAGARILVESLKTLGVPSFTATIHGLRRGLVVEASRGPSRRRPI